MNSLIGFNKCWTLVSSLTASAKMQHMRGKNLKQSQSKSWEDKYDKLGKIHLTAFHLT